MAGKAGGDGAQLRYCRGLCCKKEKLEFLGTVAVGRGRGCVCGNQRTGCGNSEPPRFRTSFSLGCLEEMVEGAESPVFRTRHVRENGASPRSREDQEMRVPPRDDW